MRKVYIPFGTKENIHKLILQSKDENEIFAAFKIDFRFKSTKLALICFDINLRHSRKKKKRNVFLHISNF